jgi:hypothetical protein
MSKESGVFINASSKLELSEFLTKQGITVLPRGEGRTTDQCELWQLNKLLLVLNSHNRLLFPLSVEKRESPDFHIKQASTSYGIEATEIINPDYARTVTLPEAKHQESVIDPSLFKSGDTGKDLEHLRKLASKKQLTGPGWAGNSVEIEFAVSVRDAVNKKHRKLIKGFTRFDQDILLIYHNHTSPCIDYDLSITETARLLKDYWRLNGFTKVYVHKNSKIISFRTEKVDVYDL